MSIVFTATIESISTRSDKTFKIIIGTQESEEETWTELIKSRGQLVKVLISHENILPDVVSAVENASIVSGNQKTPSQKLRHVIYRLWQQVGTGDSDTFYKEKMTEIIESIKLKLDH